MLPGSWLSPGDAGSCPTPYGRRVAGPATKHKPARGSRARAPLTSQRAQGGDDPPRGDPLPHGQRACYCPRHGEDRAERLRAPPWAHGRRDAARCPGGTSRAGGSEPSSHLVRGGVGLASRARIADEPSGPRLPRSRRDPRLVRHHRPAQRDRLLRGPADLVPTARRGTKRDHRSCQPLPRRRRRPVGGTRPDHRPRGVRARLLAAVGFAARGDRRVIQGADLRGKHGAAEAHRRHTAGHVGGSHGVRDRAAGAAGRRAPGDRAPLPQWPFHDLCARAAERQPSRGHAAIRPSGRPRSRRAAPGRLDVRGADDDAPHLAAPRGRAHATRPCEPSRGVSHGRPVPHLAQGSLDRLAGRRAHPRALRRNGGAVLHRHHGQRMARAPGLGRAPRPRRDAGARRRRERAAAGPDR